MSARRSLIVAVKGMVVRDRRILLLRRAPGEIGEGTWECPGGKIEFGEELAEAMMRETREETGLTVQVGSLLYATTFRTHPWRQVVILSYLCTAGRGEVVLSEEHDLYRWATREETRATLAPPICADMDRSGVFTQLGDLVD